MTSRAASRTAHEHDLSAWRRRGRLGALSRSVTWQDLHRRRVLLVDVVVVLIVMSTAVFVQTTIGAEDVASAIRERPVLSYQVVSILLAAVWLCLLPLYGAHDKRILASGAREYKALFDVGIALFATTAIAAVLLKLDLGRGFLILSVALGTFALIAVRWCCNAVLRAERRRGEMMSRVVVLGSPESVRHVAAQLSANARAGYVVVGACLPDRHLNQPEVEAAVGVPVLGAANAALSVMQSVEADTVVVANSDEFSPKWMQQLGWDLEPGGQHLVVAPSLVGIGGPRIHTRPVAGLPLIHVETPRFDGGRWILKRAFDLVVGSIMAVVFAVPLLVVALIVRLTSPGPAFYSQERVGLNGRRFLMYKFRSMRVGADDELADLLVEHGEGRELLFKLRHDPRVTPFGRFIRRTSIDELPQLFNVLGGSMSLVGPRPQRDHEVERYDLAAQRRLLLKPGMSGLWQVSGRSNLEWEDAIRLDLYYVENWSMLSDVAILLRTARQMVKPDGAF